MLFDGLRVVDSMKDAERKGPKNISVFVFQSFFIEYFNCSQSTHEYMSRDPVSFMISGDMYFGKSVFMFSNTSVRIRWTTPFEIKNGHFFRCSMLSQSEFSAV